MNCPKCGFEQPDGGVECVRCGIVFSRFKGPTPAATVQAPVPPPPIQPGAPQALPLSSSEPFFAPPPPPPSFAADPQPAAGSMFGAPPPPPPPPAAGGGTLYEGPLSTPQAGGTVYGSPGSSAMGRPVVRQSFELGQVITQTFSVYFRNFIPFTLLTTLALAPGLLFAAYVSTLDAELPITRFSQIIAPILQLFCQPVATAAITYGVYQQLRRRDASIGDCLQVGLSCLFPVLGLAIVQGIGIGCGAMLCLIPGILLAIRWAVAVPAAVEERPGVGNALSRSTYLTEGYRGEVFGVLALLKILELGLGFGAGLIWGLSMAASGSLDDGQMANPGPLLFLSNLASILTTSLAATAAAVMYYRLRSVKESVDFDQISSVFD